MGSVARGSEWAQTVAQNDADAKKRIRNSMRSKARCEKCGRRGAGTTRRYQLDSVNWHQTWALLCDPCSRDGWTKETWGRHHIHSWTL